MIAFQRETWAQFRSDAEKLFPLHWRELALDQDVIKIDVDHEAYLKLDELGRLYVCTAREDGRLIGYSIFFLMHHFHYKSAGLMAMADMYYVLPGYRRGGIGARLFIAAEKGLRELGVIRMHTSSKVAQDHTELFERLGWKLTDYTYSKLVRKER